jgi:hypothetical protein
LNSAFKVDVANNGTVISWTQLTSVRLAITVKSLVARFLRMKSSLTQHPLSMLKFPKDTEKGLVMGPLQLQIYG